MTEEADAAAQDHVRGQEEDDDGQNRHADNDGNGVRHVVTERSDKHASETVQGTDDRDEAPCDDDGSGGSQEVLSKGLSRHAHESGGDAGSAIRLDDGVQPPNREEYCGADAEADLDGLGCADGQARHGDHAGAHVLDDDAADVPAGDKDARGDRVPRPGARHQRRRHAHRIHGEGSDHSQKRQTHGPIVPGVASRFRRGTRPGGAGGAATSRALRVRPGSVEDGAVSNRLFSEATIG